MQLNHLSISQFAKQVGVGIETVRYYQRKGLLAIPKQAEGIRRYDESDIRQLRFIKNAQKAGFTLKEIKELISLDSSSDHERAYEIASERLKALDLHIAEMQEARNQLKFLADECAGKRQKQCCAILAAFEA
ncbi:MerR family transcriptional regulator [Methylophaga sp.]|uniref:MerR family transcriptional regulator n=1 Tax=Methylophaga sp. TaxID=2024840 RepID=UPI003F69ED03